MADVTVEGVISTSFLGRGERLTTQRDAKIQRQIDKGFLTIVEEPETFGAVIGEPDEDGFTEIVHEQLAQQQDAEADDG